MTDPLAVHAAALADLDGQIEIARVLGRTSLRWLRGSRRILERHAPEVGVNGIPYCFRCAGQWPCPEWADAAGLALSGNSNAALGKVTQPADDRHG